jgi:hypothetical protein
VELDEIGETVEVALLFGVNTATFGTLAARAKARPP